MRDPDDFKTLKVTEEEGHVLKVVFDHPASDRNFIDVVALRDFAILFNALRDEREARGVLLTGTGRCFSGGGNHEMMASFQADVRATNDAMALGERIMYDLLRVKVPIVCALNGHAAGYGVSIALLCDIVFAADTARISDPHVTNGVTAGDGPALWSLFLGPQRAKQYLLTGDTLTATEAERIGLINFVCPPSDLQEQAMAFARRLAAGPPLAVQRTKALCNKLIRQAYEQVFDLGMAFEALDFASDDHPRAVAAFRSGHPAHFTGA